MSGADDQVTVCYLALSSLLALCSLHTLCALHTLSSLHTPSSLHAVLTTHTILTTHHPHCTHCAPLYLLQVTLWDLALEADPEADAAQAGRP